LTASFHSTDCRPCFGFSGTSRTSTFPPSFRLKLAAKDAGLVTESALLRGLDLPVLQAIAVRLGEGTTEHGDEDFSATYANQVLPRVREN
jgi:3-hydroxyisobutyrate dehydrogenase-like beta-hydroxyacid dehydrogenase